MPDETRDLNWSGEGLAWLESLPPAARIRAEAYPPWKVYRVVPTGQHAHIHSYSESEDGSCDTCCISAWHPDMPFLTVGVFGVPFADLEPIATPEP